MANKVDELFESVLNQLGSPPNIVESEWDNDVFDQPFDDLQDQVQTLNETTTASRVAKRLSDDLDFPNLGPDERESAEGSIRIRGLDALAFYKSRRHIDKRPYRGKWGIFYLRHGLQFITEAITKEYPGYGSPSTLSYEFLRLHEWFHYRADLQTLMFEATLKRHLHQPVRRLFSGKREEFVEEALANRQVWDWAKKGATGLSELAFEFMKLQPGAYSRFDENRLQLAGEWAANVVDLNSSIGALRTDLAHWIEASPNGLMRKSLCPEYVVTPSNISVWWPANIVPPPVSNILDGDAIKKYLSKRKDPSLANKWSNTKNSLLKDRFSWGLNFRPWPPEAPAWSVKVDKGFRAHLRHQGQGNWHAYKIGSHSEMGHG